MQAESSALLELFGEAMIAEPSNANLREVFDKAAAMLRLEDQGWQPIFSGTGDTETEQFGLTLEQLKEWSGKLLESTVGAPWIGSGFRRRRDYIWRGGIRYGNIPSGGTQGKKNIKRIVDDPINQMNFFGDSARFAREKCLYAEGVAFWVGNEATKQLTAIPLRQIKDQILEPNGLGYAIAYKREWSERDLATGAVIDRRRWYFVNEFKHLRVKEIKVSGGQTEEVDQKHVIFDMHVNRATGLIYGAPDALAAYVWNGIAREATLDGKAMVKALATFALKASVKSKPAGENASMTLASTQGAGNTAVLGGANDLVPLASAGKGYDFSSLVFLVAIVATSLDLSVIDITASPGDAGSSYGAGQLMSLPTRLAMEARRSEHVEMDKRVLRWMGVEDPDVNFVPYDSGDETYRAIQSLILLLQSDTHDRQEIRDMIDDLLGRPNGTAPTEDKRPSVLLAKSLEKIKPKPEPAAPGADGANANAPQVASPNQGRSNGSGGQNGGNASNDIRRDGN